MLLYREVAAAAAVGVDVEAARAHPLVGALVGEAPGPNTDARLPLFPVPTTSAGGRLRSYSRLELDEYLGRLTRRNLFDAIPRSWSAPEARRRADLLLEWLVGEGALRVVLLGARVGAAFGVRGPWRSTKIAELELLAIPHPSGRCRIYNEGIARRRAGAAIRWAAGYRSTKR